MSINRKLAAIFYADVAGYSRLTEQDEVTAHRRVMDVLDLASSIINKSSGNVLNYAGDAILAEFQSIVAAMETAVEIQQELRTRNLDLPEDEKIQLRIGLNLGEVIQDRGEIFGEGVNLAARLEGAAKPGGICISSAVHEQISRKVDVELADAGNQLFKNLNSPVHIYTWHPDADDREQTAATGSGLPLPNKPSIAVLAFSNMSGDVEQEYFSDGISEDIITELSRFDSLFVIARNSSFHYKGQSPKVQDVGRELGVQYVIEGSVRKAGNRVRITAQLVETQTGNHIWAQRYDREFDDIFELQDDVTKSIVGVIPGRLDIAEVQRSVRRAPEKMTAYDQYLRGLQSLALSHTLKSYRDEMHRATGYFRAATELEPGYARAHTYVAFSLLNEFHYNATKSDLLHDAMASVQTAINLDPTDNFAPAVRGLIMICLGRDEDGASELNQALQLNPNNADLLYWAGYTYSFTGRADTGIIHAREAIRLNPFNKHYFIGLALAHYFLGQYEECIASFRKLVLADLTYPNAILTAAYGHLGRTDEALACAEQFTRNAADELRQRGEPVPESPTEIFENAWRGHFPNSDWMNSIFAGMAKAGL